MFKHTFIATCILSSSLAFANPYGQPQQATQPTTKAPYSYSVKLRDGWSVRGFDVIGYAANIDIAAYGAQYRYTSSQVRGTFSHSCNIHNGGHTRIAATINGITRQSIVYPNGRFTADGIAFYNGRTGQLLYPSNGYTPQTNTVSGLLTKPGQLVKVVITHQGQQHHMFVGSVTAHDLGGASSLCAIK